jgi:hypothetical protein
MDLDDETGSPGAPPFEEVRVDPRDGMVVHFAPPPEPHPHEGPGRAGAPEQGPPVVSGEATTTDWHATGHDDAGAASGNEGAREPEPPAT